MPIGSMNTLSGGLGYTLPGFRMPRPPVDMESGITVLNPAPAPTTAAPWPVYGPPSPFEFKSGMLPSQVPEEDSRWWSWEPHYAHQQKVANTKIDYASTNPWYAPKPAAQQQKAASAMPTSTLSAVPGYTQRPASSYQIQGPPTPGMSQPNWLYSMSGGQQGAPASLRVPNSPMQQYPWVTSALNSMRSMAGQVEPVMTRPYSPPAAQTAAAARPPLIPVGPGPYPWSKPNTQQAAAGALRSLGTAGTHFPVKNYGGQQPINFGQAYNPPTDSQAEGQQPAESQYGPVSSNGQTHGGRFRFVKGPGFGGGGDPTNPMNMTLAQLMERQFASQREARDRQMDLYNKAVGQFTGLQQPSDLYNQILGMVSGQLGQPAISPLLAEIRQAQIRENQARQTADAERQVQQYYASRGISGGVPAAGLAGIRQTGQEALNRSLATEAQNVEEMNRAERANALSRAIGFENMGYGRRADIASNIANIYSNTQMPPEELSGIMQMLLALAMNGNGGY